MALFVAPEPALGGPPGIVKETTTGCIPGKTCGNVAASTSVTYNGFAVSSTGTNHYIVVGVAVVATANADTCVLGATYNGNALTSKGSRVLASKYCKVEMFGAVVANPDGLGHPVVATKSSGTCTSPQMGVAAISFTNVTSTTGPFASATAQSTTMAVSPTTAQGEFVVDMGCVTAEDDDASVTNPTAPLTQHYVNNLTTLYNKANAGHRYAAASPATTTTMTYTVGGTGPPEWAIAAFALRPVNATGVRIDNFAAFGSGTRTRVAWRTGNEIDNLGFNVYRDTGTVRVKITPTIIVGSALLAGSGVSLAAGNVYAWEDTVDQASRGSIRYWLEELDLSGKRTMHGPAVPVELPPAHPAQLTRIEREPAPLTLALAPAPREAAPAPPAAPAALLDISQNSHEQWGLAERPAVKLGVDHEGWYEVRGGELFAAGLQARTDPTRLSLFVEGRELPMVVRAGDDGVLDAADTIGFYGQGHNAPSTDTRAYWLVANDRRGMRLEPAINAPNATTSATDRFTAVVERRPRTLYFAALGNGPDSNFFGPMIGPTAVTETLRVPHAVPGGAAVLEVGVQGVSWTPHEVMVEIAGQPVGTLTLADRARASVRLELGGALPASGELPVTLRSSGDADVVLLDFVRLTYPRATIARDGVLPFSAAGGASVAVSGFEAGALVEVLDVTEAVRPVALALAPADAGGIVRVAVPGAGTRKLWARSTGHGEELRFVKSNLPSRWNAAQNGGDLLVIGKPDLLATLEPLLRLRRAQGWATALVDIDDVYDEFSFGTKHESAIRSLVARARSTWERPPRAVLLVGDATFDPRGFLGKGDFDQVPTKLVDTAMMETASDDWFTDFDGDGIADVPVGRLPARSPAELAALVAKLVNAPAFGSAADASAGGPLVFVSDQNDEVNDFRAASTKLQAMVRSPFMAASVDRGLLDMDPIARLRQLVGAGPPFIAYVGHGTQDRWGGGLLSSDSVGLLEGSGPGAFWLGLTCLNGFFHDVYKPSLSEAVLARASGGAFGVWASSSLTDLEPQMPMGQAFIHNLMGRGLTVGEAAREAKTHTLDPDVRRSWVLFGDPTWRLAPFASVAAPDAGPRSADADAPTGDAAAGALPAARDAGTGADVPDAVSGGAGCGCALGRRQGGLDQAGWGALLMALAFALRLRARRR